MSRPHTATRDLEMSAALCFNPTLYPSDSKSQVPRWYHIKLRTSLMIEDVFCIIGAEILAKKASGVIVWTAAAALCIPCSSGIGGHSGVSKGGGAYSSGCSILSSVLAGIPVRSSIKSRQQSVVFFGQYSTSSKILLDIITYSSLPTFPLKY